MTECSTKSGGGIRRLVSLPRGLDAARRTLAAANAQQGAEQRKGECFLELVSAVPRRTKSGLTPDFVLHSRLARSLSALTPNNLQGDGVKHFPSLMFRGYAKGHYHTYMYELAKIIPDVELLLTLEPEELGTKILFLLQKKAPTYGLAPRTGLPAITFEYGQSPEADIFHQQHLIAEPWPNNTLPNQQTPYPRKRQGAVEIAETEALAWLEAQGLIIPAPGMKGL